MNDSTELVVIVPREGVEIPIGTLIYFQDRDGRFLELPNDSYKTTYGGVNKTLQKIMEMENRSDVSQTLQR